MLLGKLIGPEARPAVFAIDQWVVERIYVTAGHPDLRVQHDRTVQTHNVAAIMNESPPPFRFQVPHQLDTVGTVVEGVREATVDFGPWKHKTAAFGEGDDLFERIFGFLLFLAAILPIFRHSCGPQLSSGSRGQAKEQ